MILGNIDHQKFTLSKNRVLVADTIAYLTAEFHFTKDWNNAIKFVHFRQGKNNFCKMLVDDKISEDEHLDLAKGVWELYLHGDVVEDGQVVQRITTTIEFLTVERTGDLHGEPIPITPPSIGEQILAKSEEAVKKVDELKRRADNGEFDGDDGYSPSAKVERIENGATITIIDKDGTSTATVHDGKEGKPGDPGTSVEIADISESTESGGSSVVTFSDGKQLHVKNGIDAEVPQELIDEWEDKISEAKEIAEGAVTVAETAENIAKGRATGYVFDTKADMDSWLADAENVSKLNIGDNLYIRAVEVPDYWWDGDNAQPLESEKPDFTGYVKSTDYAKSNVAGVTKTGNGFAVSSSGVPSASTLTSTAYRNAANGYFISKGTLDNIFPSKFLTEIGKINLMTWNNLGEISVASYPTVDDYLDELTTYNNGYFTYDGDTYFVHIYSDADEDNIGQSLWSDKTGIEHTKSRTGKWNGTGYSWSDWVQDGWIDLGTIDVDENPYPEILDKLTKIGKFRFIDGGAGDYFHWFVQNEGDEMVIGQSYWSTEVGIQYMNYRTGWIGENGDVTWGDWSLFMSYEDAKKHFASINHNHDGRYVPKTKDMVYANGYDYIDLGEIDLEDYDDDYFEFINTLTETGNYRFVDNFDYFTWIVEVRNTEAGIGQSVWSTEEGITAIAYRWGYKTAQGVDWYDWQTWLTYDTAYSMFAQKGHNHRVYKTFETRAEFDAFLEKPVFENGELSEYICKITAENKIYIVNCGYNNQSNPKRYVRYITYWCLDTPWEIRTRSSINTTTTTYKWSAWHLLTDVSDDRIREVAETEDIKAELATKVTADGGVSYETVTTDLGLSPSEDMGIGFVCAGAGIPVTVGERYTVTIDGVSSEYTATETPLGAAITNASTKFDTFAFDDGDFIIVDGLSYLFVAEEDEDHTMAVTGVQTIYTPLDRRITTHLIEPDSVEVVDENSSWRCRGLHFCGTNVYIPEEKTRINSEDDDRFWADTQLKVTFSDNTIVLPYSRENWQWYPCWSKYFSVNGEAYSLSAELHTDSAGLYVFLSRQTSTTMRMHYDDELFHYVPNDATTGAIEYVVNQMFGVAEGSEF